MKKFNSKKFNSNKSFNTNKKFNSNKKFNDILTVLLIVVIIGIVIVLIFFGYRAIVKNKTENEAADAVEEFYRTLDSDDDDDETEIGSTDLTEFITEEDYSTSSTSTVTKTYLGEYEIKGTISISKTGIEYPVLEKATVGSLAKAVGILEIATCDEITETVTDLNVPGTNALILGHNYRNGQFFSDNDQLEIGDIIKITDQLGETVSYSIYKMYYTTADDISFLERELDPDVREITLQTCNDDSSERLIIWAKDS